MIGILLGVCAGCFAAFTIYVHWNRGIFRKMGVPTAPAAPFIGAFYRYFKLPSVFDGDLYHLNNYGDGKVVGVFDGRLPVLILGDAEMIRTVVQKQSSDFYDRQTYLDEDPSLLRLSLINLRGAHWKHVRQVLTPTFTPANLRKMIPLISQCAELLVRDVKRSLKGPLKVDIKDASGRFTLRAIASIAFGIDVKNSPSEKTFQKTAADLFAFFDSSLSLFIFVAPHVANVLIKMLHMLGIDTKLVKCVNTFAALINSEIDRRRCEKVRRDDFLQSMIELEEISKNHDSTGRIGLTRDEIIAQSVLFLAAGYETTASTLTFFCIAMAQNLECQDKLREEIRNSELNATECEFTAERLANLPYLEMCLLEAMRVYPAIFRTDRVCTVKEGTLLGGIPIPYDLNIGIPIAAMHQAPEFWPDPERFDPTRFAEGIPPHAAFAYLPFGAGPHVCIGERLAKLELRIGIVSLLRKYRIELSEQTILPVKISSSGLRTPVGPVYLRFVEFPESEFA